MAFDLERVESRWAGNQRLNASPTVTWLVVIGKYLKYRSSPNLPLAPTSPGLPYLTVISEMVFLLSVSGLQGPVFRRYIFNGHNQDEPRAR